MSKITLEPNDLGAGIFRLRSPNSNSNRSFTLPDSDGILLTLNPDGRLGIGTSNPDSELEVVGTVKGTNAVFGNITFDTLTSSGGGGGSGSISFGSINDTIIGNEIPAAGTFTDLSATSITETSSVVLKKNIMPISNAIEKITALDGVNYTRKSTGKKEIGLIAEEVEKIIPEVVDFSGDYKSISYSRLTAYLIEAVKSLKTELDEIQR